MRRRPCWEAQPIFTYSSLNTILTSSELVLSGSTLGHTGQNTKQNQMILFKKIQKTVSTPTMLSYNSEIDLADSKFSFSFETYESARAV